MESQNDISGNHRILIVGDNRAIHGGLRELLAGEFGAGTTAGVHFEIDSAFQGEEGLEKVKAGLGEGRPYSLAFVDLRMPPGWDGVETITRLWKADPDLQTVICTPYSDYSWSEIRRRLGISDSLLILKKPFDNIEVIQIAHTMTEKWLLGRQARAKMKDLDRMVALRTAELDGARAAAEAGSRAKSQFLANMSHEIRTPINGILGFTQLTLGSELTAEQRENLDTVESCTMSLMTIVTDILDFSKIESGRVELDLMPFSLRECVEEAARAFVGSARQKGLSLRCDVATGTADRVLGDPQRLRQVILNLIGNAIKFTPRGSVSVSAQATRQGRESLFRCRIQDTGIGIPPDYQKSIFEAFRQVEGSISRKYGGTGLGLAICRQLIGLMGGRIAVESEVGRGSTFQFMATFRSAEPAEPERPAPARREVDAEPLSILVAEDNKDSGGLISKLLARRGHRVTLAANGLEALSALEREAFDLILMDIQMPEMGGMEAVAQIRRRESRGAPRIPIVAVTADAMSGVRQRCLEAGMDRYLTKPVDAEELFAAVAAFSPARAAAGGGGEPPSWPDGDRQ